MALLRSFLCRINISDKVSLELSIILPEGYLRSLLRMVPQIISSGGKMQFFLNGIKKS